MILPAFRRISPVNSGPLTTACMRLMFTRQIGLFG